MTIRPAVSADAPAMAQIYNRELQSDAPTNYATEPQTGESRRNWLEGLQERGYPVWVAEQDGQVVGFGALTPFHPLPGYRFTVTGSLYVDAPLRRTGIGKALGQALIKAGRSLGYHTIIAGINSENRASIALHEGFGFEQVGYFRGIGFKDGRRYDDVCLQLDLS